MPSPTEQRRRDAWARCFARPDHHLFILPPDDMSSDSDDAGASVSPPDTQPDPPTDPRASPPLLRYAYPCSTPLHHTPVPLPSTQQGLPLYAPPTTLLCLPAHASEPLVLNIAFSVPEHHIAMVIPAGFHAMPWTFPILHFPPGDYPEIEVQLTNPARVPFYLRGGERVGTLLVYSLQPSVAFVHDPQLAFR